MGEEGAARLRLKARWAPVGRGQERGDSAGRAPGRETSTGRCSWFEKEDLNECEKAWSLLLKATSPDLHCPNWDTVPSLPEFLEKSAEEESPGHQEVFTVGMKDFQWVPFPPFHKEKHLNPKDLSPQQPTQSQSHESHPGQGPADKLWSLPSTAEKTCRETGTHQAKTAAGEDTKGISTLEVSPESHKPPGHRSSAEAFCSQQQHPGAAQSREGDSRGSGEKELQVQPAVGSVAAGQDRCVAAQKPPGRVPGPGSCEEKMEQQSEGSSALDSCPMCLMQFSGTLSQLDIDGHLARCLSESADDIMW